MPKADRKRAERRGRWAEWLCVLSLRLRLYRILARRYRVPMGEIDIVARRGGTLAIIEVKARSTADLGYDAVTPRSRQRLRRAALGFIQQRPALQGLSVRFDVMLVLPQRWPLHIPAAWDDDERGGFGM